MANSYVIVAILTLLLSIAGSVSVMASSHRKQVERIAIMPQDVVEALKQVGITAHSEQVGFLGDAPVGYGQVMLQVVDVERLAATTVRVRIQCVDGSRCVPFYILLRFKSADQVDQAVAAWLDNGPLAAHLYVSRDRGEWLVRAGSAATLVLEGQDLRISSPVICLENGRRGQRVRVMSPDHRRVGAAEVIEHGLVKGVHP
jgi:hypothetical protein